MDRETFLTEIRRLPAAGYRVMVKFDHYRDGSIRLERKGIRFCPLGALCDLEERRRIIGMARRFVRHIRARMHPDVGKRVVARTMIERGPCAWAPAWAQETLGMNESDIGPIVRAADGHDVSANDRYDRPIREAMTEALGLIDRSAAPA